MTMKGSVLTVLVVAAALAGCAGPTTKYHWGSYEPALYQYYKTPSQVDNFATELAATIRQAAEKGQKVPPGICAEYAHILHQQGRFVEAATYFEREKREWPESAVLMNAMLRSVETSQKKSQVPGKP
jgi:hypothetical protein